MIIQRQNQGYRRTLTALWTVSHGYVRPRPFRVPLFPLPPLLLALTCAGLVVSSAMYAGAGALIGLAVLAAGAPLMRLLKPAQAAS